MDLFDQAAFTIAITTTQSLNNNPLIRSRHNYIRRNLKCRTLTSCAYYFSNG